MNEPADGQLVPFTAQTRMSGLDLVDSGREIRKGAADAVRHHVTDQGGHVPPELTEFVESISRVGGTPLVVAENDRILGVIRLKDIVKPGLRERFEELRHLGIRAIMITGDNPLTAAAIAEEAGLDGFLAEATPEDKLALIQSEQRGGNLVAMTGDGTNDAPALAQADVGVAMNTGTQAAREAGNMVDLDSDPTKLIEVVDARAVLDAGRVRLDLATPRRDYGTIGLALGGLHQADNAIVAARLLESLDAHGIAVPEAAVRAALERVSWHARLELIETAEGPLLVDAAHNPAGAAVLAAYLRALFPRGLPIVFGAMRDKDLPAMLAALVPAATVIVATTPRTPRAAAADAVAGMAKRLGGTRVEVVPDPVEAVQRARTFGPTVCVAGSIYLIGDVLAAVSRRA